MIGDRRDRISSKEVRMGGDVESSQIRVVRKV